MRYPENNFPGGVWPVMLTPMTEDKKIDEKGLRALVNWYIENGVSGLFAACQSSEIWQLSFEERVEIVRITVDEAAGRVPVVASGHTSDSLEDQAKDISAVWNAGADAVILLSNRLAAEDEGDEKWLENWHKLKSLIAPEIKLGIYECPVPYKRLLTPRLITEIASTGRFYFLKDTCCDAEQIREKLACIRGTNLKLYNANATTVLESLRDGAAGFSGVMANFHPRLWAELCSSFREEPEKADRLQQLLSVAALIERQYYPTNAKWHLRNIIGLPMTTKSRVQDDSAFGKTQQDEVVFLHKLTERYYKELY